MNYYIQSNFSVQSVLKLLLTFFCMETMLLFINRHNKQFPQLDIKSLTVCRNIGEKCLYLLRITTKNMKSVFPSIGNVLTRIKYPYIAFINVD